MEAIASEDLAGAMLPQDMSLVKVEDQQKKAAVVVPPQDDNDSSNIVVPAVLSSTAAALPRQHVRPGAFAVRGPGDIPQDDSFLHVDTAPTSTNNVQDELVEQLEPESLFKAVLVDDSEIPSASIFDHEAAEKAYCRRQGWKVLATFAAIGILGAIIAIVILLKPKPPSPTSSPTLSPTLSPLFDFLAGYSSDNGTAHSTIGSSQQLAMSWLQQSTLDNMPRDYTLLQFYALAVFNYATGDTLSKFLSNTWLKDNGTVSQYNFCYWENINCEGGKDITNLQPISSQLVGSLPPEIGLLKIVTSLYLYDNYFTGTLPTEIGNLTRLYGPILKNNTFNGTLPTEIGLLTSLDYLDLSSNTFTGTLPTEIGLLTRLYGLTLKNNRFTGPVPTQIGLLTTSLSGLGLSNNSFTGSVPLDFGPI